MNSGKWVAVLLGRRINSNFLSLAGRRRLGRILAQPGPRCTANPCSSTWFQCHSFSTAGDQNDSKDSDKNENRKEKEKRERRMYQLTWFALGAGVYAAFELWKGDQEALVAVTWRDFKDEMLARGEVQEITIHPEYERAIVKLHDGAILRGQKVNRRDYSLQVGEFGRLEEYIREAENSLGIPASARVPITYERTNTGAYLALGIMVILSFVVIRAMRRGTKSSGFSINSLFDPMRKAQYKLVDQHHGTISTPKIKFKDVAGLHEAKVEVKEFVDYLKRPSAFTKLGAKLPKGALLLGPPGCGKTLLAKAVASECGVPFLAINGTDFIEMIGGLGASRIRSLFADAKKRAPCIIYMDEIDAVGRKRSGGSEAGMSTGEEEQTLNQLLVELDGMDTAKGVVVIASTNRAEVLDKALLRRGRFDRHINIDLPTVKERIEIFDLYLGNLKLDKTPQTYSQRLAQLTPGFSGADINNVCNEAAIHAATTGLGQVTAKSIDHALERVIAGAKKRSSTISPAEKKTVAYHESGHALVGWLLEHTDGLLKVTIVPRTGAALGFAQYNPADRHLFSKEELFDRMCMTLGGRAAENLIFGRISTGAEDDLKKVTRLAYSQVKNYGMSETLGPLSFQTSSEFTTKPYSKKLQHLIDLEASHIVSAAYKMAESLLENNRKSLEKLATALMEKETLTYQEVKAILGPPKFGDKNFVESVEQVLPTPEP